MQELALKLLKKAISKNGGITLVDGMFQLIDETLDDVRKNIGVTDTDWQAFLATLFLEEAQRIQVLASQVQEIGQATVQMEDPSVQSQEPETAQDTVIDVSLPQASEQGEPEDEVTEVIQSDIPAKDASEEVSAADQQVESEGGSDLPTPSEELAQIESAPEPEETIAVSEQGTTESIESGEPADAVLQVEEPPSQASEHVQGVIEPSSLISDPLAPEPLSASDSTDPVLPIPETTASIPAESASL